MDENKVLIKECLIEKFLKSEMKEKNKILTELVEAIGNYNSLENYNSVLDILENKKSLNKQLRRYKIDQNKDFSSIYFLAYLKAIQDIKIDKDKTIKKQEKIKDLLKDNVENKIIVFLYEENMKSISEITHKLGIMKEKVLDKIFDLQRRKVIEYKKFKDENYYYLNELGNYYYKYLCEIQHNGNSKDKYILKLIKFIFELISDSENKNNIEVKIQNLFDEAKLMVFSNSKSVKADFEKITRYISLNNVMLNGNSWNSDLSKFTNEKQENECLNIRYSIMEASNKE